MKALVLNCTLKCSPEASNTQALADILIGALQGQQVEVTSRRVVDHHVAAGVKTDMGGGDEWPDIHAQLLESDILVVATPTWLGRPSSIAQRVLERMDAMITEKAEGIPVGYGRVAGVVCTGNEDGAHHVISEISGGLIDIGYTVPGQAWTYWNQGPGPGESYLQSSHRHEWSARTARQAAANLITVAHALSNARFTYNA